MISTRRERFESAKAIRPVVNLMNFHRVALSGEDKFDCVQRSVKIDDDMLGEASPQLPVGP